MPMKIRLIVEMIISLILYGLALLWVSGIPEGTSGMLYKAEEPVYEIYVAETPVIKDIPKELFRDPPVTIEVNYATPSSAIEEPKKAVQGPTMTYFSTMQLTAYVATGCPCADGNYPCVGWTVACNDSRLWHKTIYIEGYGTRYVHDTGGMPVDTLDLFVGSLDEAYQVGRRNVEVYLVGD